MSEVKKVWGVNSDGTVTECKALPENRGQHPCHHMTKVDDHFMATETEARKREEIELAHYYSVLPNQPVDKISSSVATFSETVGIAHEFSAIALERKFKNLNRELKKEGFDVNYSVETVEDDVTSNSWVMFSGRVPSYSGYKIIGRIDKDSSGEVEREQLGDEPFTIGSSKTVCDHCDRNKGSRYFYMEDPRGDRMVVSEECTEQYIGTSSLSKLPTREDLDDIVRSGTAPGERDIEVTSMLAVAVSQIRRDNEYISPKVEGRSSTCDRAVSMYRSNASVGDDEVVTESDRAKAESIVSWLRSKSPKDEENSYLRNLRIAASQDKLESKHAKLLVSAANFVPAKIKESQESKFEKAKRDIFKYAGRVGETVNRKVATVVSKRWIQGVNGNKCVLTMRTDCGERMTVLSNAGWVDYAEENSILEMSGKIRRNGKNKRDAQPESIVIPARGKVKVLGQA